MAALAILAILGLALYLLSDLLFRWMGWGALAHGPRNRPRVALTFDDGPDPDTTPALLEILGRHGVRATFFLTGTQAMANPELVEKIHASGHEIASHGRIHRPPILMAPWTEWSHTAYTPPHDTGLYRPPHGAHSPLTRPLARLFNKRVALWDVESKDWGPEPVEKLLERLLEYIHPGSVVLLHDGVPKTLELVDALIPKLKAMGFSLHPFGELGARPLGFRQALARALQGFDERYDRSRGVRRCRPSHDGLFRAAKVRYRGPKIEGVADGAWALEIHLDSRRASALTPFQVLKALRRDLEAIAEIVRADPEIALVFGPTPLEAGARRLGFRTVELRGLPGIMATLAGHWFEWLYQADFKATRLRRKAKLIYMKREEIIQKYSRP